MVESDIEFVETRKPRSHDRPAMVRTVRTVCQGSFLLLPVNRHPDWAFENI